MKQILLVTSSPRGEASYSTQVARDLVAKLQGEHPGVQVVTRDLSVSPPPVLDPAALQALFTPAEARSAAQNEIVATSDAYVNELFASDLIVIASGMVNFGVPTQLKSWIDQIARAGLTFKYGEAGPEGLVKGKKVYLALASGGVYSNGPLQTLDHQSTYLHSALGFLGMTEIETILVEGTAMGPDAVEIALKAAHEKIAAVAA